MSKVTERQAEELKALAEMPDDAIDTSDIPEIADFSRAVVGRFHRPVKQAVTIRLDPDVLAWFKAGFPKYQAAMSQALREYMKSHG